MTVGSTATTALEISPLTPNTTKTPWKLGDPSSFEQLFSSNLAAAPPTATASAPTPAASAPAPAATLMASVVPNAVAYPVAVPVPTPAACTLIAATVTPATVTPATVTPATVTPKPTGTAPATFTTLTWEQGAIVRGPDGATQNLNPMELASAATASLMAAKLGGTVSDDSFGGGYSTSVPTREISFSNSTVKVNAGLAASLFATYGDAQGSQAWQIINRDLGRDPQSTGPLA